MNERAAQPGDLDLRRFAASGPDRADPAAEPGADATTPASADADRLKLALAVSEVGVWEWQLSTNTAFLSSECRSIIDPDRSDLTYASFNNLLHPDDADVLWRTLNSAVAGDGRCRFEFRVIRASGEIRWLAGLGRAIYDEERKPLRLIGTLQDITGRKRTEEALAEEATRRRILMEQSRDGIVVLDETGKVYEANPRYAEMLGYSADEMRELHVWDWDIQWTRDELLEMLRKDSTTGNQFVTKHRRKDGSLLDVEISTNGAICGDRKLIFCICREISERIRSERALRESEERFQAFFNNANGIVWIKDAEGRFLTVNRYMEDVIATPASQLIGRTAHEIFPSAEAAEFAEHDRHVMENGRSTQFEESPTLPDGPHTFLSTKFPLRDPAGHIYALGAFCTDITERKRMEASLRDKVAVLQTLHKIDREIMAATDRRSVLDLVCWQAAELVHATKSAIAVRMPSGDFEVAASFGLKEPERACPGFHRRIQEGLQPLQRETQHSAVLHGTQCADAEAEQFHLREGIQACIQTPLMAGDDLLGVLMVFDGASRRWTPDQLQLLTLLAGQAAIAMKNTQRFDETRRRLDETALVFRVALAGAEGRSLDDVVSQAAEAVCEHWKGSTPAFLFADPGSHELRDHRVGSGAPAGAAIDLLDPMDVGIAGRVAREGLALASEDGSEMAAPLRLQDQLVGVVALRSSAPGAYSSDDLRVLSALAGQLATIFEKSRLDTELALYTATLEQRVEERTAEVRGQQARTQAILDALGEGVVVTSLDGGIEYVNSAIQTLTGFGPEDVIGKTPRIWKSGRMSDSVYTDMWSTILSGKTWRGEVINQRKDNSCFDADATIAPIFSPDDPTRIVSFVGALRDISLRKQAEADIRRALAQEKELGELKSQFVSTTSHEFRTPLSTIISSTELLQHYGAPWPEEKRQVHLRRITTAARSMNRLLNDVLTLGRTEAARVEFAPLVVDLVAFCRDRVEEMQLTAGSRYQIMFVSDEESMPVEADEMLLGQIVSNLIGNAIKYSPEGGSVRLSITSRGDRVTFEVTDQGLGIPEDDRERIFETFHRAANVRGIPGTGLGLAIVKKSAEIHGGTIGVTSTVGQGSVFTVAIPMKRPRSGLSSPCVTSE